MPTIHTHTSNGEKLNERDYVSITTPRIRKNTKTICSKSKFFSEPVKYRVTEDSIIFEKVGLGYIGATIFASITNSGWRTFAILCENEVNGRFNFDEDSNEDKVIIYFK